MPHDISVKEVPQKAHDTQHVVLECGPYILNRFQHHAWSSRIYCTRAKTETEKKNQFRESGASIMTLPHVSAADLSGSEISQLFAALKTNALLKKLDLGGE